MWSRLKGRPFIWLPIAFLVKDLAAWQYVFSYEPGITEKAVRIHHFLLIPGVFYAVGWSTPTNVAFGAALGLALRRAAKQHFPLAFTLIVLTWDFLVTGIVDFAGNNEAAHRFYQLGMMPGRFVSHILAAHKVFSNGHVLYTVTLLCNVAAALLITIAYCRLRRKTATSPLG